MNREDFPFLKQDIIYFDSSATTLKPKCVIDKICEYYSLYSANAHRGDYDISYKVSKEYEDVRHLCKEFINARRVEEIIFTSGATDSINMVVNGFFKPIIEEGDEILITESEHASNVLPWFNLASSLGAVIKYIPLDENNFVSINNIKKMITPKTKVIALAHITNVVGDIREIKKICELAHQNNIFVVVDGAQAIGHIKVDVTDMDVDFYAFSGHKMFGPTGIGVLYGKYELLSALEPTKLGGGMNESFDDYNNVILKDIPTRFEAGTPNVAGVLGLGEAIRYINKIGIDNIKIREDKLREYLINKLVKFKHVDILNVNSDSSIVAFNIDGIFSEDVSYYLNKYNICVRAGNHCAKLTKNIFGIRNSIRVSLAFYNTYNEIDEFISLISDVDKIKKEMF